jgi:hypothetical protein
LHRTVLTKSPRNQKWNQHTEGLVP